MKINLEGIDETGAYIEENGKRKKLFRYAPRYFYIWTSDEQKAKEIADKIISELREQLEERFVILKEHKKVVPDIMTENYRLLVYFRLTKRGR